MGIKRFISISAFVVVTILSPLFKARAASYEGSTAPMSTSFSKSNLKQLINNKNIKSIHELLIHLPDAFLNNFVAVFASKSLQEASPQYPRIIMFSQNASLVLTYNGHVSQRGYEALEVMSYDYAKARFEFEEIVFEDDLRNKLKNSSKQDTLFISQRRDRTGINPTTCVGCHKVDTRPNWNPYPIWPGVFGQLDGEFDFLYLTPQSKIYDKEIADLKLFVSEQKTNLRYKNLKNFDKVELFINAYDKKDFSSTQKYLINTFLDYSNTLTKALSELNFHKIASRIKCHPLFEKYKHILYFIPHVDILNLGEFSKISGIPLNLIHKEMGEITNSQLQQEILLKEEVKKHLNISYLTKSTQSVDFRVALVNLVLKTYFNMSLHNHSMTLNSQSYIFQNGIFGIVDLIYKLKNQQNELNAQCSDLQYSPAH